MSIVPSPAVLVACDDPLLLDELVRYLEEIPQWRLPAPAHCVDDLLRGVQSAAPDVVVVSGTIAQTLANHARACSIGARVVVFSRQETTAVLRAGLKLGAQGFVLWPQERPALKALVERGLEKVQEPGAGSTAVHAVWSPKGGAGASVIAAHLAAGLAKFPERTLLVDLDLDHGDQASILKAESQSRSIVDLLRMGEEVSVQMVRSVAWNHPEGFQVVLSAGSSAQAVQAGPADVSRVIRTLRAAAGRVVADVPSTLTDLSRAVLQDASTIVMVLTPDLLGLRRARSAVAVLDAAGVDRTRIHPVLNQAGGRDIGLKELSDVLGLRPATRINADLQIYRCTNRGEISPSCSRMLAPLVKALAAGRPVSQPAPAQVGTARRTFPRAPEGFPNALRAKAGLAGRKG